jgi:uncharacterized protein
LQRWNNCSKTQIDLKILRKKLKWAAFLHVFSVPRIPAIEVKNNKRYSPKDLHSLKAFCSDYPEATPILLHRGSERTKVDGILCLPCLDFFTNIFPDKPLVQLQ